MISLPEAPRRIARLPKDGRGYPVPYFVMWFKHGQPAGRSSPGAAPDFRYADQGFRYLGFKRGLCWLCGDVLGAHKVYVIGPMCVINRTTSEPACHRDCAEYAAKACPFLINPREKRNLKGLDPDVRSPGGTMIKRNPGCTALYETKEAVMMGSPDHEGGGWLIRLGAPERIDWWAEGRGATRGEVMASIESGYPLLFEEAKKDGQAGIHELGQLHLAAMKFMPAGAV